MEILKVEPTNKKLGQSKSSLFLGFQHDLSPLFLTESMHGSHCSLGTPYLHKLQWTLGFNEKTKKKGILIRTLLFKKISSRI